MLNLCSINKWTYKNNKTYIMYLTCLTYETFMTWKTRDVCMLLKRERCCEQST